MPATPCLLLFNRVLPRLSCSRTEEHQLCKPLAVLTRSQPLIWLARIAWVFEGEWRSERAFGLPVQSTTLQKIIGPGIDQPGYHTRQEFALTIACPGLQPKAAAKSW